MSVSISLPHQPSRTPKQKDGQVEYKRGKKSGGAEERGKKSGGAEERGKKSGGAEERGKKSGGEEERGKTSNGEEPSPRVSSSADSESKRTRMKRKSPKKINKDYIEL